MSIAGRLDLAEAAFAQAALGAGSWDAAMEQVAEATEAFGAMLLPIQGTLPGIPRTESLLATIETYFNGRWFEQDVRYRAWPVVVRQRVGTEFDFITPEEMARSPYYQEFLGRHGLRWFAGIRVGDTRDRWGLSIQRTVAQGPFSPEQLQAFQTFSARISGSVAVADALGFARLAAASDAFDASNTPVVLFDHLGQVLKANAAAERLLGTDLQIRAGRFLAGDPASTRALDRALHDLLWMPDATAFAPPVTLQRRSGRPLLAYPMRLPGITADAFAPCRAIVVLIDVDPSPRPPESALRILFGLTEAEARVAARLAGGEAIQDIAEDLRITTVTGRNHLRAIFAKTGTHRQAELALLLARLRAPASA